MALFNRRSKSESLPRETIELLAPYFPTLELRRVKIFPAIPQHILRASLITPLAITLGRRIYFRHKGPGGYDPYSLDGIELLAHELTHVEQFARFRWIGSFGARYVIDYGRNRFRGLNSKDAYIGIRYEREAQEKAGRVLDDMIYSGAAARAGLRNWAVQDVHIKWSRSMS